MISRKVRFPFWVWIKVLGCLVVLDVVLFRIGLFWRLTPDFWGSYIYLIVRTLEAEPVVPNRVLIVGNSVILLGVDEAAVSGSTRRDAVPVSVTKLAEWGSSLTESALVVWQARRLRPWLVVYCTTTRDFPKVLGVARDAPLVRILYDSSVELPSLPRRGTEAVLDAYVKRYWKLYRYRAFVQRVVASGGADVLKSLDPVRQLFAADEPAAKPMFPPEAGRFFLLDGRLTPEMFDVWNRWRHSRRFGDYLEWMRAANHGDGVLNGYRNQTFANYGPEGNPQVETLDWMLGFLARAGTRTVLVYLPENPIFRDPEAKPYLDEALSDGYGKLFARETDEHHARFVDLRNALDAEDFYDLIHPNVIGRRKLSDRIATIIEEEWRARQQSAAVHAP